MKKIFTTTTVLALGVLIAFACKKSTTTTATTTTTSTTSSTSTTSTPSNTTTTNYSVDGTAAVNITVRANASNPFYVIGATPTSAYPSLQIAFSGTVAPTSGTYTIVSGSPAAGQCSFSLVPSSSGTSLASSGVVTVTAATSPGNTVAFSSISCTGTGGTHTVTGALKY